MESGIDDYSTYHHLWRIEESFWIMKSQPDARLVYLQKDETITGHFLIWSSPADQTAPDQSVRR